MYKNQLQELAQRSCFNLPSYTCIREGPDHAPRFKAAVNFNGEVFESPAFCLTLRQAEHSAAEVALGSLSHRGPSHSIAARILDETGVYKNLLQEISQRVGAPLPSYTTFRSGLGHLPVFTCTVELAGITFTGEPAKNKKQAEKNAAMAAWSSLKQLARQTASSSTEPENNDGQEQITIARALLNYRLKEKMAMANNPNASPFPKKFPIPPERRPSSSLQPSQHIGSKILALIRPQSSPRSRPSSPSTAEGVSSHTAFFPRRFPSPGAPPYVPVGHSHYRTPYHGMAPPVTIRTAVPVFSAPPLPPPARHHHLPPVMGPPPIRMASPVRIRQAVPVFAAPPPRPMTTTSQVKGSLPSPPKMEEKLDDEVVLRPVVGSAVREEEKLKTEEKLDDEVILRPVVGSAVREEEKLKMEEKLDDEVVLRPVVGSAVREGEKLEGEVKDLEESAAIDGLKQLEII